MPLRVAVIVEGHGEDGAIRPLLERTWYGLLGGDRIEVLHPFRRPQGTLLQEVGLKRAVDAAKIKLDNMPPDESRPMVLILIDTEGKCPREIAPRLLRWAREVRSDADTACVMPHPMFETWFAAAALSLRGVNGLPADLAQPEDVEGRCLGKGWLRKQLPRKYSERIDQPRFAARIELALCRNRSASFDKLCRELALRLPASQAPPEAPSPPLA